MCDVICWPRGGPQLNRGAGDERRFRDAVKRKGWGVEINEYFRPITPRKPRHQSRVVWADWGEEDVKRIGPQLDYRTGWDEKREEEKTWTGEGKAGIEKWEGDVRSLSLSDLSLPLQPFHPLPLPFVLPENRI